MRSAFGSNRPLTATCYCSLHGVAWEAIVSDSALGKLAEDRLVGREGGERKQGGGGSGTDEVAAGNLNEWHTGKK